MNLLLSNRKIPVIKLITALLAGVFSVLLTRISYIYVPSLILLSVSAACFSFLTYYTGLISIIPALAVFILVFLTEDFLSAMAVITFMPLALTAGFSLRSKKRPVATILSISVAYILYELVLYFISRFWVEGSFSFAHEIEVITSSIESYVNNLFESVSQITGNQFSEIEAIVSLAKAVAIGTYISIGAFKSCVIYIVVAMVFRFTKSDNGIINGSIFDIKTSKITAAIYIICLLFSMFSGVSPDNVKYYSMLAQNILLVLTPVLVFSGIYYILTIKFKIEHSSPFMLVLTLIVSLFGAYPIFIFYLALSGVTYSLKYSNLKKIEGSNYDQETQC